MAYEKDAKQVIHHLQQVPYRPEDVLLDGELNQEVRQVQHRYHSGAEDGRQDETETIVQEFGGSVELPESLHRRHDLVYAFRRVDGPLARRQAFESADECPVVDGQQVGQYDKQPNRDEGEHVEVEGRREVLKYTAPSGKSPVGMKHLPANDKSTVEHNLKDTRETSDRARGD